MTNCLECNLLTKNIKYCSNKCANIAIGRAKIKNKCIDCSNHILSRNSRRCFECHLKFKRAKILICKLHNIEKSIKNNQKFCKKCRADAVIRRRKKVKEMLVKHFGGKCILCGYNKYIGALYFHHTDPALKNFGIAAKGVTISYAKALKECEQCILICANCHAEQHKL